MQKPGYRADLGSALSTGLPAARSDCSELHSEILAALLVESPVGVGLKLPYLLEIVLLKGRQAQRVGLCSNPFVVRVSGRRFGEPQSTGRAGASPGAREQRRAGRWPWRSACGACLERPANAGPYGRGSG